jgi:proline iminopeptidase
MVQVVALPGGRAASYQVIGSGRPALMFAGGPGFSASYMNGDAELLADVLCSYLIDPPGSGSSTPPADPAGYSPEGHARFYEQVRQALGLPEAVVLGHSFGATTALTYAALFPGSTAVCGGGRLWHRARCRRPARRRGRGRGSAGPARTVAVV